MAENAQCSNNDNDDTQQNSGFIHFCVVNFFFQLCIHFGYLRETDRKVGLFTNWSIVRLRMRDGKRFYELRAGARLVINH